MCAWSTGADTGTPGSGTSSLRPLVLLVEGRGEAEDDHCSNFDIEIPTYFNKGIQKFGKAPCGAPEHERNDNVVCIH